MILPHGVDIPYLNEIVVFLVATVLVIPLFHRIKLSPILGYLLVGGVVGPYGLALTDDVEEVQKLAELGVIFLLFTIGLELSLRRLWNMRRLVFGLGSMQVILCGIIIGIIANKITASLETAIILGACLALSSTAMVVQLLIEKGEFSSKVGRSAFAILLFQDLAVVPILLLTNFFGDHTETSVFLGLSLALLKALIAITLIFVAGRLMLRPLFRSVATTQKSELFMAMSLLAILGTALLTGISGLSMSLGAFLAGILLAETEFRHQIETDIKPFKGLLLGLFFVSVGMGIDFSIAADKFYFILLSVLGLFFLKGTVIALLSLFFGLSKPTALRNAFLLGQAGEFAFVVIGIAKVLAIIPSDIAQLTLIIVSLSMIVTPFVNGLGCYLVKFIPKPVQTKSIAVELEDVEGLEQHILIAGFGRVGKTVSRILNVEKATYIGIDTSVTRLAKARKKGYSVYYGDAGRIEILKKFNVQKAAAVVVTFNDPRTVMHIVKTLREHYSELPIYARASDINNCEALYKAGATVAIPELVESSLQLGGKILRGLGTPMDAVNQEIEHIRDSNYVRIKEKI